MKAQTPTPAGAAQRQIRLRVLAPIGQRPDASATRRRGRFSSGNEQRPDTPDKLRRGSFADGYPTGG